MPELNLEKRVLELEAELRELRLSLLALKVYVAAQATPGNLDVARAVLQVIDQTAADLLQSDKVALAKREQLEVLDALKILEKHGGSGKHS